MAGRLNPKRSVTGVALKRDGLLVAFASDHGGPISFGTLLIPAEFLADLGLWARSPAGAESTGDPEQLDLF